MTEMSRRLLVSHCVITGQAWACNQAAGAPWGGCDTLSYCHSKQVIKAMKRLLKNFWLNNGAGWRIGRIVFLLMVSLVALMMIFENSLIFFPTKYPDGLWEVNTIAARPGEVVPRVEDCWFQT